MFTNLIQLGYLSIVIWVVIGNRLVYRKPNPCTWVVQPMGKIYRIVQLGVKTHMVRSIQKLVQINNAQEGWLTNLKQIITQSEFQSTADCPKVFNMIKYPIGGLAMSWFLVEQDFIRVHPLNNPTTLWIPLVFRDFRSLWNPLRSDRTRIEIEINSRFHEETNRDLTYDESPTKNTELYLATLWEFSPVPVPGVPAPAEVAEDV